jgi:carbamoyltransferase
MYIIGVSAYYHDSSACLFKNGILMFACEEEKFTGIKHDSSFPKNTIEYIFKQYKLTKEDIDCVCYYEDPKLRFGRKKAYISTYLHNLKVKYNLSKISKKQYYTPHHLSHMAYAFASSKFDRATVVSIDGVGETSSVSIGGGMHNIIQQIKTIEYPHSLGLFYSAMTAYLGFKPNEGEYKVMGLASYGNPTKYISNMRELISYENNTIKCNMEVFCWDRSNKTMFNENMVFKLPIDPRLPNEEITQDHKDLAAAIQLRYEDIFFKILEDAKVFYKSDNLCLGGGCAYNGRANGKIIKQGIFKNLWIPPAPSDAGSAIGSCIYYLNHELKLNVKLRTTPFLGPKFSNDIILKEIKRTKNIKYKEQSPHRVIIRVADYLNDGLVVGWYQGKIEFGARALGNRSILANPTIPGMQDKINKVIKKREGFRPFAPMVTFEDQIKYFKSKEYIPYMNQVVDVQDEYIGKLPAVTHIDGTARVQSVTPYFNPIYELLKEFEKKSGYPILLNTSFNIKDKTMVLTPKDAIETFLDTEMDILVLNNYIILKANNENIN